MAEMQKLSVQAPKMATSDQRPAPGGGRRADQPPDHRAAQQGVQNAAEDGLAHRGAEVIEQEIVGFVQEIGNRTILDRFGDGSSQARAAEFDGFGQHQVPERIAQGQAVDHLRARGGER